MPIISVKKKPDHAQLFKALEDACNRLSVFRDRNRKVFTTLRELEEDIAVLENQAKAALRPLYSGRPSGEYTAYAGSFVQVIMTSRFNREINDIEQFEAACGDFADAIIERKVNLQALDAAIERGDISEKDVGRFIKRTPATPAFSVKPVTAQKEEK